MVRVLISCEADICMLTSSRLLSQNDLHSDKGIKADGDSDLVVNLEVRPTSQV